MEKEHTYKEIELRSEEVQEVMNRVPAWILRSGITVLFVIVVALVAGSYWFKYPDVIAAEVTVSTQDPPAYVVAEQPEDWRICMYKTVRRWDPTRIWGQ